MTQNSKVSIPLPQLALLFDKCTDGNESLARRQPIVEAMSIGLDEATNTRPGEPQPRVLAGPASPPFRVGW